IHKLLWQKEQEAGKMCADEFVHNVQYTIQLSTQTPAPIQKTKKVVELLQAIHFSATMLDTYLRCPLKFFYSFVLGLEEPDTVPEELGAEKIGLLIHNALNTLFQPFVRKKLSVEVIDALDYEYAVDRAFKSFFGAIGQGRSLLIRDQILKQVHAFLQDYQRSILKESSIEILSLEDSVKLAHQSVVFRSRFDRVENRDGKIWIIDYKTSANENRYRINLKKLDPNDRATRSKSIGSLQLPLYVLLYSTLHKVSLENLSAAYLFLGKQRIDTSIEVPLYNSSEETLYWQPQLEALIYSLIEEIRSPDVPFRPAEDFTKECIYCPMQTLCGTQWIKEWNS
ncbi:MAG TPA: PD-(D/E)XK nuclease family protein, partial [Bacteroidota bacterium]|nr:PD-(D/E)XK nuclease family protein [Bacteroidota bacterium]